MVETYEFLDAVETYDFLGSAETYDFDYATMVETFDFDFARMVEIYDFLGSGVSYYSKAFSNAANFLS